MGSFPETYSELNTALSFKQLFPRPNGSKARSINTVHCVINLYPVDNAGLRFIRVMMVPSNV